MAVSAKPVLITKGRQPLNTGSKL